MIQLAFCLPVAVGLLLWLRSSIRGTEMGEAFSSFFRQSGIIPILFFMLFYRFAEAMVAKMSVLFLKGDHSMGGLALDNTAIGLVKGAIGVAGIICGGIIGGILVSRLGLKKGFWMIAIMMHLPILLYIIAALTKPSSIAIIATIDFIDQFGYGLGYAGYTVYLMRIAQRGQHRTAHYAIGTGLGATFIALSGILGGVIQANGGANGYIHVFVAALLFGIPGLITLAFIPHDEPAESN
jgi:PAT family beta-lactamase induction signal transducer AmpG